MIFNPNAVGRDSRNVTNANLSSLTFYNQLGLKYELEECPLKKPDFMTFEIFQIMKGCIRVNTELRLTFAEVSKAVERIKDIIQTNIFKSLIK